MLKSPGFWEQIALQSGKSLSNVPASWVERVHYEANLDPSDLYAPVPLGLRARYPALAANLDRAAQVPTALFALKVAFRVMAATGKSEDQAMLTRGWIRASLVPEAAALGSAPFRSVMIFAALRSTLIAHA